MHVWVLICCGCQQCVRKDVTPGEIGTKPVEVLALPMHAQNILVTLWARYLIQQPAALVGVGWGVWWYERGGHPFLYENLAG